MLAEKSSQSSHNHVEHAVLIPTGGSAACVQRAPNVLCCHGMLCVLQHMLAAEQLCPEQLAYDRPSPKLLSFVRKHYGLSSYVPQSNNFVVFEQHFQHSSSSSEHGRSSGAGRSMRSSRDSSAGGGMPQQAFNCTWGNGRQNVHIIGSAAATEQQHDKQWVSDAHLHRLLKCCRRCCQLLGLAMLLRVLGCCDQMHCRPNRTGHTIACRLVELARAAVLLAAAHISAATNALAAAECAAASCICGGQQWLGGVHIRRAGSHPHVITRRARMHASWRANTAG